jgi:molecular chaperone GrpE
MQSSPGTEHDSETREALLTQLAAAEDRFLRARADLENYRKRVDRELERRLREEIDDVLREWLEAVDSVERALALQPDGSADADDLRAVLEQMEAILARRGVRPVGEAGAPFDPELHEAVAVVPSADQPAGTIAEIARSGYTAGDRIIRPAQVVVTRPPADGD